MMSTTATTWASGGVIEVMVVALPSSVGCGLHDLLYHSARSCLLACLLGTIVVVVVLTSSIIVLASSWRFLLWLASIEPRRHQGGRRAAHSWAKWQKKQPKIRMKTILKLTDYATYVCNNLTNFPYTTHSFNDWKWKLCPSAETCLEKIREITIFKWTYFRRILAIWSHCAAESQVELESTPRERNKCMYVLHKYVRKKWDTFSRHGLDSIKIHICFSVRGTQYVQGRFE